MAGSSHSRGVKKRKIDVPSVDSDSNAHDTTIEIYNAIRKAQFRSGERNIEENNLHLAHAFIENLAKHKGHSRLPWREEIWDELKWHEDWLAANSAEYLTAVGRVNGGRPYKGDYINGLFAGIAMTQALLTVNVDLQRQLLKASSKLMLGTVLKYVVVVVDLIVEYV